MAAPDLTARQMCAVNKVGTDDAGYNPVGAPWSRLTIAAALADLAANYTPATASNPHVVSIGPGVFTLAATALVPNLFLQGTADSEGRLLTTIQLTGNLTLDATWAAGAAVGGISDCIIASEGPDLDFTMPAVAGNPARLVILENIETSVDTITFAAAGTGDQIQIEQVRGNRTTVLNLTSGIIRLNNLVTNGTVTITSGATLAATVQGTASSFAALVLTKGAAALTATFDAVSVPLRAAVTLNGGAVFVRSNDANGEAYSPTTPGDWSPALPTPATVQNALDQLGNNAGGGGSGTGTFVYIVRTGNRSSAAWGTAGCAINDTANTFTDSSSAGVVATAVAVSFGIPTFAASAGTTYTDAAAVYIAGNVAAGTNVTITNSYGLWNVGKTRLDSLLYLSSTSGTSAGGILFGTATNFYQSIVPGFLAIDAASGTDAGLQLKLATTTKANLQYTGGNLTIDSVTGTIFRTNSPLTTALTLGSDQSALLAPAAAAAFGLKINATTGFATNLIDAQVNGVSKGSLSSTGVLTTASAILAGGDVRAGGTAWFYWNGRSILQSGSDGVIQIGPSSGTTGITIDAATNGTAKFRNFANNADAAITALSFTSTAPTGGAGVWQLGKYSAGVLVQAGSVLVNIDGMDRQLLTA